MSRPLLVHLPTSHSNRSKADATRVGVCGCAGEPAVPVTIPVFSVALDVITEFREAITSGQSVVLQVIQWPSMTYSYTAHR